MLANRENKGAFLTPASWQRQMSEALPFSVFGCFVWRFFLSTGRDWKKPGESVPPRSRISRRKDAAAYRESLPRGRAKWKVALLL